VVDFGRYGPGGDYYLFQSGREEPGGSTSEDVRPGTDGGQASAISADPYGLISRWKIQQENESRQTL
jgi:hypothetical protein